jgi:hypothetical protein
MEGGTTEDRGNDVIALADGSVVVVGTVGSTNSPLGAGSGTFALRLSKQGALLWSKVYPGTIGPIHVAEGHDDKLVIVATALDTTACAEHHGLQDAWVAEISKADGSILAKKCIGGDDDDIGNAVVARGTGGSAHYFITGQVDSNDNGNVGPNYNGGTIESPDALLGYWDLENDTAYGHCFGSNSIDRGTAVLGGDVVFVNANSSDPGDYGSTSLGGIDFLSLELSPHDVCANKPCGTVTRFGGPSRENVNAADGTTIAGQTLSTTGDVGCPEATTAANSVFVATYENGTVSDHGCLNNGSTLGVEDVMQSSSLVAITGLANPATGGDLATATVDGTISGSAGYIALYDGDFDAPEQLVVVGNQTNFYGVTLRADGCIIAVGTRVDGTFGDVFVYTRPVD